MKFLHNSLLYEKSYDKNSENFKKEVERVPTFRSCVVLQNKCDFLGEKTCLKRLKEKKLNSVQLENFANDSLVSSTAQQLVLALSEDEKLFNT